MALRIFVIGAALIKSLTFARLCVAATVTPVTDTADQLLKYRRTRGGSLSFLQSSSFASECDIPCFYRRFFLPLPFLFFLAESGTKPPVFLAESGTKPPV